MNHKIGDIIQYSGIFCDNEKGLIYLRDDTTIYNTVGQTMKYKTGKQWVIDLGWDLGPSYFNNFEKIN